MYGFVHDIPNGPNHPTWHTLAAIQQGLPTFSDRPIALIWGMRDWCFHSWYLERFLDFIPQAEVVRLPDAGHWVVEDAPHEVIGAIDEFMSRNSTWDRTCQAKA